MARRSQRPPADLLLRNGLILDVFSGRFFRGDVAVAGDTIVGFRTERAQRTVDLKGAFVVPGLIDAHVHMESSQLTPAEFARAVLPHGTTTIVADPHEIANVLGLGGIRYMLDASAGLPLRIFLMAPSCVPATPLETSGAALGSRDIAEALTWERLLGLGEVMNVPGILSGDAELGRKIGAAEGRPIDGHAPGLSGSDLWAYLRAGPDSDHECTTLEEAREKLQAGMRVLIREGTAARNLDCLLPLLTPASSPFVHFATDDRHPETLLVEGHIDDLVRRAISGGVDPSVAVASASIHTARAYGLRRLGALAPGYPADLLVLDDLAAFRVDQVYTGGQLAAEDGRCVAAIPRSQGAAAGCPLRVDPDRVSFRIPAGHGRIRVLGVVPGQVITEELHLEPTTSGGEVTSSIAGDVLKIAVVERHRGTNSVGLGFVRGFGLERGALGSTVAHDSHNVILVGVGDEDLRLALTALVEMGGGQAVVADGEIQASHPLPAAGILSDRPLAEVAASGALLRRAAQALGCGLADPFMTLSFLALPVIPHLKITDQGIVDVDKFRHVPLFVDEG